MEKRRQKDANKQKEKLGKGHSEKYTQYSSTAKEYRSYQKMFKCRVVENPLKYTQKDQDKLSIEMGHRRAVFYENLELEKNGILDIN